MTDDDALAVGNLAPRVLAAIGETERMARAAKPGPWAFDDDDEVYSAHDGEHGDLVGDTLCYVRGKETGATGKHIERHDPEAVLRRCAADRKIVALATTVPRDKYGNFVCRDPSDEALVDVLTALAEGYGITAEEGQ